MNNLHKCDWCVGDPLYEEYHDNEWGVPVFDDDTLFEFLILETFQAGLSWITVLKKRDNFRKAFDGFNYKTISNYSQNKIDNLLNDAGIIRNKLKVKATITNAQSFILIQNEFGSFRKYIWSFVDDKPIVNSFKSINEVPANTLLSSAISKDLKKRGFKFVGTTVVYAYMQAIGMVNDHETSCFRYNQV